MRKLLCVCSVPILSLAIISIAVLMYPLSLFSSTSPNLDFDGSGVVDFPDFLRFISAFGSRQGEEKYDINAIWIAMARLRLTIF